MDQTNQSVQWARVSIWRRGVRHVEDTEEDAPPPPSPLHSRRFPLVVNVSDPNNILLRSSNVKWKRPDPICWIFFRDHVSKKQFSNRCYSVGSKRWTEYKDGGRVSTSSHYPPVEAQVSQIQTLPSCTFGDRVCAVVIGGWSCGIKISQLSIMTFLPILIKYNHHNQIYWKHLNKHQCKTTETKFFQNVFDVYHPLIWRRRGFVNNTVASH